MWRFEASHRRATPKGQNHHLLHSTTSRSSTYIEPLSCARGTRSFSNRVSYSDRLTCCDARCLTRCHLASVSDSCPSSEFAKPALGSATPAVHFGALTCSSVAVFVL